MQVCLRPGELDAVARELDRRCETRRPRAPVVSTSLIAIFLARSTMFWIIAPELKSLKYSVSLSPLA